MRPAFVFKFSFLLLFLFSYSHAQTTRIVYLSGTDKDHTVNWDFLINTGQKKGSWNKIAVPSNWEQQGFATYNYFQDVQNPEEQGTYKHHFNCPAAWEKKKVFIVFEGSMTDTKVAINGQPAGAVHQGGYYRFKYDITALLKTGDNLLEVVVNKKSENASINLAQCRFKWKLVSFPAANDLSTAAVTGAQKDLPAFNLAPGEKGLLQLNLPANWTDYDGLYLTAIDPHGRELFTWTWPIKLPDQIRKPVNHSSAAQIIGEEVEGSLVLS